MSIAKSGRADNFELLFWTGILEILAKTLGLNGLVQLIWFDPES